MVNKDCELCKGSGWYGDNGPGIRGNREYVPCEYCNPKGDGDYAVLGDGWRDVRDELPENSNMVLGAWIELCGDVKLWNYAVVKYNRYNQNEWMKDTEVVKVEFWQEIDPPAFA